jgi:hypothetical protein
MLRDTEQVAGVSSRSAAILREALVKRRVLDVRRRKEASNAR